MKKPSKIRLAATRRRHRSRQVRRALKAGTCLGVLTSAVVPLVDALVPVTAHAAEIELGNDIAGEDLRSKERAAELYVSALQSVAGTYLNLISQDLSGELTARLADADTTLPAMAGGIESADRSRFDALGIRAAFAGGQLAVWVVPGELRANVAVVDIELAAERLAIGMIGRIVGDRFHRDGLASMPISPDLASLLPPVATGIVVAVQSPADIGFETGGVSQRRLPCAEGFYGFGTLEERPFRRTVKGDTDSGIEWIGEWTEISSDCQPESSQTILVVRACPSPESGWITYRVRQQIIRHPEHSFRFLVVRDEPGPENEVSRNCNDDGRQLLSETTMETETKTLACAQVHVPDKLSPSEPDYSGTVRYERRFRVVTSSFAGDEDSRTTKTYPIDADWREVWQDCTRTMTRPRNRQEVMPCPASHPSGTRIRSQAGIETYTDYPTRDDVSLGIAWSDEWAETTNSCHRSWSQAGDPESRTIECDRHERSTTEHWSELETDRQPRLDRIEHGEWTHAGKIPGCTITSGNDRDDDSGNGSEREEANNGWDIDGDGRADFEDIDDAREEMENRGISGNPRPIADGCGGGCRGSTNPDAPDDDDSDNGGGNDDDDDDGGWCFLTTAVTSMRGEADDGLTLTTLRRFRDGWLSGTADGPALIAEYRILAPRIVAAIPRGHIEWAWIADRIDAAREAILDGRNEAARQIYVDMVRQLQKRWL